MSHTDQSGRVRLSPVMKRVIRALQHGNSIYFPCSSEAVLFQDVKTKEHLYIHRKTVDALTKRGLLEPLRLPSQRHDLYSLTELGKSITL
jgi:DNA-binding MarR family transcriptional regulator